VLAGELAEHHPIAHSALDSLLPDPVEPGLVAVDTRQKMTSLQVCGA